MKTGKQIESPAETKVEELSNAKVELCSALESRRKLLSRNAFTIINVLVFLLIYIVSFL